jgi:hypothetical protein
VYSKGDVYAYQVKRPRSSSLLPYNFFRSGIMPTSFSSTITSLSVSATSDLSLGGVSLAGVYSAPEGGGLLSEVEHMTKCLRRPLPRPRVLRASSLVAKKSCGADDICKTLYAGTNEPSVKVDECGKGRIKSAHAETRSRSSPIAL